MIESLLFYPSSLLLCVQRLAEPEAWRLGHVLGLFDDAVLQALQENEPSALVQYLLTLARAANVAHSRLRVLDVDPALGEARALLFAGAMHSLQQGLHLLGLRPLQHM